MDEWDALGPGMKIDRRATDWGLASFGIGGCFLLMAPVMLVFNVVYWVQDSIGNRCSRLTSPALPPWGSAGRSWP